MKRAYRVSGFNYLGDYIADNLKEAKERAKKVNSLKVSKRCDPITSIRTMQYVFKNDKGRIVRIWQDTGRFILYTGL